MDDLPGRRDGGLLFGYDWVVIGGAKPFYESYFNIADSPFMQGLAMSAALFGCLIGAAASGMFTDRYGRKWLLVLSAFLFAASSIGTAPAPEFITFNIARLVGGVGIGLGVKSFADVHRGDQPRAHARPICVDQSIDGRDRHPGCADRQLVDCPRRSGRRDSGRA